MSLTYSVTFPVSATGLTLTGSSFVIFQKLGGGTPTNAAPTTVTEVGLGIYKFAYTAVEDVVFALDSGTGTGDSRYVRGVLSPTDVLLDASVSSRASQTTANSLATQAGLDAVNSNIAVLDSRVQTVNDTANLLYLVQTGRWKVASSGADANTLTLYQADGTTALVKFALKDATGNPTSAAVFERVPL